MKINVFPQTCARSGVPVMQAFVESLQNNNEQVKSFSTPTFEQCDAAVIWSVLWIRDDRKQIWNMYREKGINVIVLEVGALKRNEYWRVGINGITNEAIFGNKNSPSDRWNKLGIQIQPWKNDGDYILICSQNQRSHIWPNDITSEQWVTNCIDEIRKVSNRPIVVRPHPRAPINFKVSQKNVTIMNPKFLGGYDDFDYPQALEKAWAVVNYSSNPSYEAAINGVPIFVDKSSLSSPVGNLDLSNIENPMKPAREQWAYDFAYCEWSVDEIQSGIPWKRIKPHLKQLIEK